MTAFRILDNTRDILVPLLYILNYIQNGWFQTPQLATVPIHRHHAHLTVLHHRTGFQDQPQLIIVFIHHHLAENSMSAKTKNTVEHVSQVTSLISERQGYFSRKRLYPGRSYQPSCSHHRHRPPALWLSGKDTRSEIGRYGFEPGPSQTKDFKIGISS
ncbi:hypothetical protein ElyMa_001663600 [Elysia marginata]|uniref:Uncharacterized protein n=1 Tax=Elysia marginata TaxID=1093978 RepID=A0AAV4JP00_9GAST|nr:hypothetical protein ElyMa_001663600 [Elysia marginata]